jgi:uridine kinase
MLHFTVDQYLRFVKPSFDNFVQPSSRYADVILPPKDNAVRSLSRTWVACAELLSPE